MAPNLSRTQFGLYRLCEVMPNSHRPIRRDKTVEVEFRGVGRCELNRPQSATGCRNLEKSKQVVVYRIITYWLHNQWNLDHTAASPGSFTTVSRTAYSEHPEHVHTSDFKFSVGGSLTLLQMLFTLLAPTGRVKTRSGGVDRA